MSIFSKKRLVELTAREEKAASERLTVMLVDDEDGNRAVMRAILAPHYELIEASDGQQALECLRAFKEPARLACIVSDHRMPRMTGVQLFEQTQLLLPDTCRIIVTGYVDVAAIIDSINLAQIYQFIVKPFEASDFLLTVRRAVEVFILKRQLLDYQAELERKVRQRTDELMTANRELEASARQILALYNNASCGYHSVDRTGLFIQVNDTELAWLGRSREELVAKLRLPDVLTPASLAALTKRYPQLETDGWLTDLADVEAEFLRPDGSSVPVLLSATAVGEHGSDPALARYTVFDITWRKRNEAQVVHQASHDALTGLPNRTLLRERATQALEEAARNRTAVSLMFLDLDHFKQINDTLGHQVGDQLLVEASRRITHCVRKHDTVARIGGDEFVLALPMAVADPQIHAIAQKIVAALAQPFQISGHTLRVSASVGVSLYPQHAATLDQLMELADAAMYVTKKQGRNGYHIHQSVTDT